MINMTYCRFENTFKAWLECKEVLYENELSNSDEKQYAKKLLNSILQTALDEEIIEGFDMEALNYFIESSIE